MEFFKNMFEAPKTPDSDKSDGIKADKNISVEYGHGDVSDLLNEKINDTEHVGSYGDDELVVSLDKLEREYWELNNNQNYRRFKKELGQIETTQDKISELKDEIEESLYSDDRKDDNYKKQIDKLRTKEAVLDYIKQKFSGFNAEEIENIIDRIRQIEKQVEEIKIKLKEKYGNQDIKTEQGQYLN
mgnify:FL=1